MYPGLNYKEDDEKFILLGKVFETIDEKNSKDILSRTGFKNRSNIKVIIRNLKSYYS